jgi:hypothetical protein
VELLNEAIHTTADGRRLLVVHGDAFDAVVLYHRWLAYLGDKAYELMMRSTRLQRAAPGFKLPYWSLSAYLKKRVKNAVSYICSFEEAVAHAAAAGWTASCAATSIPPKSARSARHLLQRWRLGRKLHRAGRRSAGAMSIVDWRRKPAAWPRKPARAAEQVPA